MPALSAGNLAPDITLQDTKGGQFSLKEVLEHGPVLLAFFKISCPTCQFTLPYLERLYTGLKGKNVPSILGISQNGQRDTEAFLRQYGISFRVLLDDPKTYSVSNAYGITNVPTLFYIGRDGTIELSSVGWSRSDLEAISQRAAQVAAIGKIAIIQPHEQVPESKAG